jgi:hypothetical protein
MFAQTFALILLILCIPMYGADAAPVVAPAAPAPVAPVKEVLPVAKEQPAVVPAAAAAQEPAKEDATAIPVVETAKPADATKAEVPATPYTTYLLIVAVIGFLRWVWAEYKAWTLNGRAKTAEGTLEAVVIANDAVLTKDEKQDTGEVVEKVKGGLELLDSVLRKNGMLGKSKGE